MQWVFLYLSISHDACYCEHVAQHGAPSRMYHIRALPVVLLPAALEDHVSGDLGSGCL
jgi:hypothetical protein